MGWEGPLEMLEEQIPRDQHAWAYFTFFRNGFRTGLACLPKQVIKRRSSLYDNRIFPACRHQAEMPRAAAAWEEP